MATDPEDRVPAIVLAAGEAQRFGSPKLLMPFRGSTIIGSVVAALEAARLHPIIVVAGSQTPAIAAALDQTSARILRNPPPERGMLSSLRVGAAALPSHTSRFLLALADQPRVSPEQITHLLREHLASGRGIAIPTYRGKRGHPVAFHHRYRTAILALDDTHTLRHLIHSHPDDIVEVQSPSDAVLRDIDTPEQYHDELRLTEQ